MNRIDWDSLPNGGDLFGEMQLADIAPPHKASVWPGLAICGAGAAAAAWLSDHYGFPVILLGLLVGLSLNFVSRDPATHKGLDLAGRTFLRIGIVILGLQVTLAQVVDLGGAAFAALLLVMLVTVAAGMAGARFSGQSSHAGLLAGGATAICGASAALALYGVIGKERLSQAQFALTLVVVSLASAFAMSVYPVLAAEFGLSARAAGFLTGASIHDVAQAIGGGYAFSNEAGTYATIIKLARVAMLAPLVALAGWFLNTGAEKSSLVSRLSLPWFITAFLAVLLLNSLIAVPPAARDMALIASKAMLLLAVTATAMRSRMDLLLELGWRAAVPVLAASLASFLTALAVAILFVG
ncbi:MAG TPA: putative sulfate exporter family transporter [Chakrabartia sp.]|jgi:uncharacterized integral membrane protein (TIGR00698 family)|nr:putative sulfate exporter family transporter [Chakrabartia sp.]